MIIKIYFWTSVNCKLFQSPCISHKKFEFEANKEKVKLQADLDQGQLANQELQEQIKNLQEQMTDLS